MLGVLKNKFTSFVKTRVRCFLPGNIPFDFDEIRKLFCYLCRICCGSILSLV